MHRNCSQKSAKKHVNRFHGYDKIHVTFMSDKGRCPATESTIERAGLKMGSDSLEQAICCIRLVKYKMRVHIV